MHDRYGLLEQGGLRTCGPYVRARHRAPPASPAVPRSSGTMCRA